MTSAESRRRKALVERAHRLLPRLPDGALYEVAGLLERALSGGPIPEETYAHLQRLLRRARRRKDG